VTGWYRWAPAGLLALWAAVALAEESSSPYAVHGQLTYTEQESDRFNAPYGGPNSLSPDQGRETFDATLYLGRTLGTHGEAWINLEVDQGFGLDNTLGLAGFSSGEAYKVGNKTPYLRLPRAFVRETWNLGGDTAAVEASANQFATRPSQQRWVLTVGKFGVPDVFDTSRYAHDPRADFLNWTAVDAGTFDYAADAWGFTVGAALERYAGPWAVRLGLFDLSTIPNNAHLTPAGHQFQAILELEHRHTWADRDGKWLVTAYDSRGRMGLLSDALALAGGAPPDVARVRAFRSRTGVSVLAEQALTDDLGVFARLGDASGNVEVYEFTDVDRSLSLGASIKGARWGRSADTVGLAMLQNRISSVRQAYLAAGGLGILVGDGRLPHAGPEEIVEAYYAFALGSAVTITADLQSVRNPAYNADRGPVTIGALRLHAQF